MTLHILIRTLKYEPQKDTKRHLVNVQYMGHCRVETKYKYDRHLKTIDIEATWKSICIAVILILYTRSRPTLYFIAYICRCKRWT